MSALLATITALWGLWVWTVNDTTLTPLSTALLSIAALLGLISALNAHYGSDTK